MFGKISSKTTLWKKALSRLALAALGACSSPGTPPAVTLAETYAQRREVSERPHRGRVFDRNDSLLIVTQNHYTLTLPRRQPLDSVEFNCLLGWPAGALQARVASARPSAQRLGRLVQLPLTHPEAEALRHYAPAGWHLAVQQQRVRTYTVGVGAPVLGYGPTAAPAFLVQAQQLERGRFYRMRSGGVESYYNALLNGHRGYYHPLMDAQGKPHGTWATDTAFQQGQDLHLSIDIKLQAYAERLLGEHKGYIVALEPTTGEILCCVSGPTYDPATLTTPDRGPERRALLQNADWPLLNRPALLANPPGSVFKLVNAAVALQLGAIKPDTSFRCDQSLINCVHEHPRARNLTMALKYSCNPYFYQVLRAVIEPRRDSAATAADSTAARHRHLAAWVRHVKSFGLDTLLGVDTPREQPGFLPTPAYYDKARRTQNWKFTSIYSLSIGQGEINLTGLQTANALATIANRGWYITPHFVRSIGSSGQPLPRFTAKHHTLVDSINFAALIPGMVAAMQHGGTAELASLADVGITVAGKTGTVQNDEGDDHATFAGFAPATHPKIVVAVYLENAGFGGLSAAPCAALIMEKYLKGHIAKRRQKWDYWLRCGNLASRRR
ncbi:MAG: peptidoglycan D,D-transpeptidase FtsI family protein [Janthinobacterium lividum]